MASLTILCATPRPTALIISGAGRYADPWHPFDETSTAIGSILESRGFSVMIQCDVERALAGFLTESTWPSLLVVNVGLPRDGFPSPESPEAESGLAAFAASRRPLLALHSSSTSFTDSAVWADVLGGTWLRGTSYHPDYGPARVAVDRQSDPCLVHVPDFEVHDEMYTALSIHTEVVPAATHIHSGEIHPLVWLHERGPGRTVYDALGHTGASYAVPERQVLINAYLDWLLAG